MITTRYYYSSVIVDHTIMEDGEKISTEYENNIRNYGVFMLEGQNVVIDGEAIGTNWSVTGEFAPKGPVNVPLTLQANGKTEWLCFSQLSNEPRAVRAVTITDSLSLPVGSSFYVLDGYFNADGVEAEAFDFFRARDYPVTIHGSGKLVIFDLI